MTPRENQLQGDIANWISRQFMGDLTRQYQEIECCILHAEDAKKVWDKDEGVLSITLKSGTNFAVSATVFARERWAEVERWLKRGQYPGPDHWLSTITNFYGEDFDRLMEGPNGREIVNAACLDFIQRLATHVGADWQICQKGSVTYGSNEPPAPEPELMPAPAPPTVESLLERIEALEQRLGVNHV